MLALCPKRRRHACSVFKGLGSRRDIRVVRFRLLFCYSKTVERGRPASHSGSVSNIVACKALEAHTSSQPGVTVVLFHQRQKDQARFASTLKQADGSTVEIRIGKDDWQPVTVSRLRMCFGRGLLVFAPGTIKLREKDEFRVRFTTKTTQQ
jgi:hypothetical protein